MKIGKIIGRVFMILFALIVLGMLLRIFMMDDKGSLTTLTPTDAARTAYGEMGAAAFTTHKLHLRISADGYFTAHSMVYCASAGELQITARYNESVFGYLKVADGSDFTWELRDADGNTVSVARVADTQEKYFYRYFRLIFDGVEFTEDTELRLYLCSPAADYPAPETVGFPVHLQGQQWKPYDLSKTEREALK